MLTWRVMAACAAVVLVMSGLPGSVAGRALSAATDTAIKSAFSGLYLAVDGSGQLIQSARPAIFRLVAQDSSFQIVDRASGKCISDGGTVHSARPMLAGCTAASNMLWNFPGEYVEAKRTGLVLDVRGMKTVEGSVVHLWTKHVGANQRWSTSRVNGTRVPAPLPEIGFSLNGQALSGSLSQEHYDNLGAITPGTVWARMGFSSDGNWQGNSDKYFHAATKARMKVLLRASFPASQYDGRRPVDVNAYGDFVAAMASRFRGKGLGGSNPVLELPNEINGTRISGATYAAAACNAYSKLRQVDPNYKIIGASENVYAANWKAWLEDVYKNGFANCSDGVSFHNYDVPGDAGRYEFLRATMKKYGDLDAMVWLTEFGASTCPGASGKPLGCQTERQQAEKIVGTLEDLRDNYPWITHAFIYADEDIPQRKRSNPFEAYFGIYRNDSQGNVTGEKPAVEAIKKLYR